MVIDLNHALIKNSNQALQGCFDDEPLYEIEAVSMTTSFSLFASFDIQPPLRYDVCKNEIHCNLYSCKDCSARPYVLLLTVNLQVMNMEVKSPVKHWNLTLDGWIDVIA